MAHPDTSPPASSLHLYFSALVACQTASLFGYSVGFIGGVLVLPSFQRHFALLDLLPTALAGAQARIVLVWLVGALLGVLLGVPLCKRGRKWCLCVSAGLYVAGAMLQLVDVEGPRGLVLFGVGRFLNGLGVGAGTLVSPMYIAEISPPATRGMLMSGYQTILQLSALAGFWGAFLAHAIFVDNCSSTSSSSANWQWRLPVALQLAPGTLLLLGTVLIPETPRARAEQGDWDGAEKALAWLRGREVGDEVVSGEMAEVREAVEVGVVLEGVVKTKGLWSEVRGKGDVRRRLGVGVGLMVAQNMVGLNALNYYCPVIFMSAGFNTVSASLFLTGIFGLVKLLSALAFMFVFVKMRGNLFWLKLGSIVCGVAMFILAHFVRVMPPPEAISDSKITAGGLISVAMVYIFTISFSVSLGPISWNVCSEIFPLHINAKCCAITTCTQWLFQIVVATMTPYLLASAGWVTYLIYGACCVTSFFWVTACVPETRGVPLGRPMDALFGVEEKRGPDVDEEDAVEEMETSALLQNEHRRRRISLG